MDKFQREYIGLIRSALTEKAIAPSSDFDWIRAVNISKAHNIASILFYGASNCNISQDTEYMKELKRLTFQSVFVSTRQMYEIEQIESVFKKENVDYMPLKGIILKPLYPKPEMRTMGDADILIRLDQYSKIEEIVRQLGYVFQYESDHERVWQKPSLYLELHKSVMSSYNEDFYQYFGDGWKIANKLSDCCRYEMSDEDFYIYIFVHFTKHYRISGIGIKHLLDLWVYIKSHPDLDWAYIARALEEMHLAKFHQNISDTINAWFCDSDETEISDLITTVIFNSGQYGSEEMAIVNRALQKDGDSVFSIKIKKVFKGIFPSYSLMKIRYKILEKVPLLLPIMWVVRCFEILFSQNHRIKHFVSEMKPIDSKHINENKRALYVVGLDFHHEE